MALDVTFEVHAVVPPIFVVETYLGDYFGMSSTSKGETISVA